MAPKREQWGLHLRPSPICFTDDNVLIATFITREDVTTLARRAQPGEALPLRLHGVFLDADTGTVKATKEWSITRPRGGVVASSDGGFTVLTPAFIALYSSTLELVRDFKLSSEQQSHLWDFHVSPNGKSILVEYHYPEAAYQWLNSDSMDPQVALWSRSMPAVSISDDKEIASFRDTYIKAKGMNIFEALIQPRNGAERTVCRTLAGQAGECGEPTFLSNDLLARRRPHELIIVAKTSRNALLKTRVDEDEWLGNPLPSRNGKRFAITVSAHKGGSAFFDIEYHSVLKRIEIYDVSNPHPIYTLDAKQHKIKDVSGVALSPDGSLMAILMEGVVEVYQLPPGVR